MIEKSDLVKDFDVICEIINDASLAYKGVIPKDRWKEPYMSKTELETQIAEGVEFWTFKESNTILGVMGIQYKEDVTLIRHAYVRTIARKKFVKEILVDSRKTGGNINSPGKWRLVETVTPAIIVFKLECISNICQSRIHVK